MESIRKGFVRGPVRQKIETLYLRGMLSFNEMVSLAEQHKLILILRDKHFKEIDGLLIMRW